MLSALHGTTSIFAPEASLDKVRLLSKRRALRCPACDQPVYFKGREGGTVTWHFAHYDGADCSLDDPDYGPESREHKLLKWAIYQWLMNSFGGSCVHVEKKIETGQVADVLLITNKRRIAFEVQRSPISAEAWQERRDKYREASVHDVWMLVGDRHFDLICSDPSSEDFSTEHNSPGKETVRKSLSHDTISQAVDCKSTPACERTIALKPGHLARGLFAADGRLLWVPEDAVDHLKEKTSGVAPPSPSEVNLREIDGIGYVYSSAEGDPTETIEQLKRRPFSKQPQHLVAPNTWRAISKTKEIDCVLSSIMSITKFNLCVESVNKDISGSEANTSGLAGSSIAFESPYRSAKSYSDAWTWEQASHQWNMGWERRRQAYEERERRARDKAWRVLDTKIGQVVYDKLPEILEGCRTLFKSARDMKKGAICNHIGLESGIQKWPVENWTPLADLDTELDWVFGVDRRLWQTVAYSTQFYHPYAKRYRERVDLGHLRGYKDVRSGYLLKALHEAQLLKPPSLEKTLEDTSEKVQKVIQQATNKITGKSSSENKYDYPNPTRIRSQITFHGIRHIAAESYLAQLARLGFLYGNGPFHGNPVHGKGLLWYLKSARRLVEKSHVTSREFALIGRTWLDVAVLCADVQEYELQSFFIKSPHYPPYFKDDERARLGCAIQEDRIPFHVGDAELCDRDGCVLVSLDWKR
ncbi:competence protein CoiA [Salisaeta longa]|uniref:competence protein CoiA n=1 Tax=Salisaeta longa TaxID=503170 RepID=UPI0004104EB0|nr:competence protein CoiA family protein [Salisaeta longa]